MRGLSIFVCAFMSGCAAQPDMTREQFLAGSSRTFADSQGEILDAAREVLVLADGSDFRFAYPNAATMQARRGWGPYAALGMPSGVDLWTVTATPDGHATVSLDRRGGQSEALYRLFWDRVSYQLGNRADWPECAAYGFNERSWLADPLDALCDVTTKNQTPVSTPLAAP